MKVRVISALILSLCIMLSALAFPAYAADSHALETSVTSIMTAGTDGSLTVDEQWTINAFDGDVNEVSLCLALTGDTLLRDKSNLISNRVSVNRLTIAEGDNRDNKGSNQKEDQGNPWPIIFETKILPRHSKSLPHLW